MPAVRCSECADGVGVFVSVVVVNNDAVESRVSVCMVLRENTCCVVLRQRHTETARCF